MSDEREKLKGLGEADFEAHKLKGGGSEPDFQAHKLKETEDKLKEAEEPESDVDDAGDDFEAHKLKQ